ncbi:olfactory receptor 1D2-like [Nerophis lumbriciformis]|uniref:olfactory receptor 1D2-like n=1 Tax=Nerophis lumbriciformis TaxID=546530 RepID=UPI003BAA8994
MIMGGVLENHSDAVFVLHGLNESASSRQIYFSLALASYVVTLLVNVTLIVTVCVEKTLHEPIYIFLCNLCINGIFGASTFYPKLLSDLLAEAHVISYAGCLTQIFAVYGYIFCEFASLTVMALDRYVAICWPLRYRAVMTPRTVARLLALTWCLPLLETACGLGLTARLPLCGRHIHKLFCTNWEVVKLSCVDTTANNMYGFALMFLHVSQAGLIVVSYAHLVHAAVRSRSVRRKFVQTCMPHLLTLLIFTGSLLFDTLFSRYGGGDQLQVLQNMLAVEFLVVPPLVNPVIYGINLQQIRWRIVHNFTQKDVAPSDSH